MQVRIFVADKDGYIKISVTDLEKLLNEAYQEGYERSSIVIGYSPELQKGE